MALVSMVSKVNQNRHIRIKIYRLYVTSLVMTFFPTIKILNDFSVSFQQGNKIYCTV